MSAPERWSSRSTPTTAPEIDWSRISDEAAWTTVHLAWPLSLGLSTSEVAARVGETNKWVTTRMMRLRDELEQLDA